MDKKTVRAHLDSRGYELPDLRGKRETRGARTADPRALQSLRTRQTIAPYLRGGRKA